MCPTCEGASSEVGANRGKHGVGRRVRAQLDDRLLTLIRVEKTYRQEGLTIALLARKLELPKYRLRRVINEHHGYRNLNSARLKSTIGFATTILGACLAYVAGIQIVMKNPPGT